MIEYDVRYAKLTHDAAAAGGVLHVDVWEVFAVGDIIHASRTGENMLVDRIDGGELHVTRALGSAGWASALKAEDEILVIGSTKVAA